MASSLTETIPSRALLAPGFTLQLMYKVPCGDFLVPATYRIALPVAMLVVVSVIDFSGQLVEFPAVQLLKAARVRVARIPGTDVSLPCNARQNCVLPAYPIA